MQVTGGPLKLTFHAGITHAMQAFVDADYRVLPHLDSFSVVPRPFVVLSKDFGRTIVTCEPESEIGRVSGEGGCRWVLPVAGSRDGTRYALVDPPENMSHMLC